MRSDFCAFILTHGRPDRVLTYKELRNSGYTGPIYLVIDDEDKTADQYRERYGDEVVQFCKADIAARFDEADNFDDRRAIFYARNACFDLARELGYRYFVELDDDYTDFYYRYDSRGVLGSYRMRATMDEMWEAMIEFHEHTPALAVALSQGGDWIGGDAGMRLRRKCMNSFICSVDRPFSFVGRVNEDVNTYVSEGRRGSLFYTVMQARLNQPDTQKHSGGMSDLYLDAGTYIKTFYSVIIAPSAARVGQLSDPRSPHVRIHHAINGDACYPKILREDHRKVPA